MSIVHSITTLWKANPSAAIESFRQTGKAVRSFRNSAVKDMEDVEQASKKMSLKDVSKTIKGYIGKGSNLQVGLGLATGTGAAFFALKKTVDVVKDFSERLVELRNNTMESGASWKNYSDVMLKSLPILNSVVTTFENIDEFRTGKKQQKKLEDEWNKQTKETAAKDTEGFKERMGKLQTEYVKSRWDASESKITAQQKKILEGFSPGFGRDAKELLFGKENKARNILNPTETDAIQSQIRKRQDEIKSAQNDLDALDNELKKFRRLDPSNPLRQAAVNTYDSKAQIFKDRIFNGETEVNQLQDLLKQKQNKQQSDLLANDSDFRTKAKELWENFLKQQTPIMSDAFRKWGKDFNNKDLWNATVNQGANTLSKWVNKGLIRAAIQGPDMTENRIATSNGGWFGPDVRQPSQNLTQGQGVENKSVEAIQKVEKAVDKLRDALSFVKKSF